MYLDAINVGLWEDGVRKRDRDRLTSPETGMEVLSSRNMERALDKDWH